MIFGLQGLYYLLTGIWPVIHIYSFMFLTGYKTDVWLVKMVGLLSVAIGLSLLIRTRHPDKVLSPGAASAFLAIDVFYTAKGTISLIYLPDAFLQAIIIILVTIKTVKARYT